jgi:hypothetical protein
VSERSGAGVLVSGTLDGRTVPATRRAPYRLIAYALRPEYGCVVLYENDDKATVDKVADAVRRALREAP